MTEVAVKPPPGPDAMVANHKDDFGIVLPPTFKPETYVRLAQGALRRDPKLLAAAKETPVSLMVALLECARLGHEPGTDEFYLTPRKTKVDGQYRNEVLGIEGYRGVIKRMFNSGTVSSIVAEVVYSKDDFRYVPGIHERPIHHVDWFGDRGELLGAYAYAVMKDGATSKVVVIGPKDVARSKAASTGADSEYSPWQRDPDAMYRKTALHRLEPFVAKSATAHVQADANAAAEQVRVQQDLPAYREVTTGESPQQVNTTTGEVVHGEVVHDDHEAARRAALADIEPPPDIA